MPEKILELGSGMNPEIRENKNIIHSDHVKLPHIEIVFDLEFKSYPFKDNSFDGVIVHSVLEHTSDLIAQINEIYRVCKDGAEVFLEAPYYNSFDGFGDPSHKSFFSEKTMDYFTDKSSYAFYSKANFIVKKQVFLSTFLGRLIPERWRVKSAHYIGNLITGIQWTLIVKKKKDAPIS